MIKLRIDGKVREFETEKELKEYLDAISKPKRKKKYKNVEQKKDETEENGEA